MRIGLIGHASDRAIDAMRQIESGDDYRDKRILTHILLHLHNLQPVAFARVVPGRHPRGWLAVGEAVAHSYSPELRNDSASAVSLDPLALLGDANFGPSDALIGQREGGTPI